MACFLRFSRWAWAHEVSASRRWALPLRPISRCALQQRAHYATDCGIRQRSIAPSLCASALRIEFEPFGERAGMELEQVVVVVIEINRPALARNALARRPYRAPLAWTSWLADGTRVKIARQRAMNSFIWCSQIRYDIEIQSCKPKRVDPGGPLMRLSRSLPKNHRQQP